MQLNLKEQQAAVARLTAELSKAKAYGESAHIQAAHESARAERAERSEGRANERLDQVSRATTMLPRFADAPRQDLLVSRKIAQNGQRRSGNVQGGGVGPGAGGGISIGLCGALTTFGWLAGLCRVPATVRSHSNSIALNHPAFTLVGGGRRGPDHSQAAAGVHPPDQPPDRRALNRQPR